MQRFQIRRSENKHNLIYDKSSARKTTLHACPSQDAQIYFPFIVHLLYRAQDVLDLLLNCQELLGITLTLIPSLSRSTGFVVNDFSQMMPK